MYPSSLDSTWILEIKNKDRKKKKETEPAMEIIEGRLSRLKFFWILLKNLRSMKLKIRE